MKKLVEVTEVQGEGLDSLMGEQVLLFCLNYIYAGKLVGINETFVQLENAGIVYETGELGASSYKDFQRFPGGVWYVQRAAIESFGPGK